RDVLEITRARIVAVSEAVDRRFRADHEHLFAPARAPKQRRRAHLAAHRARLAVRIRDDDVQIRVRVDEIDAGERSGEIDGWRSVEAADAVMRERRGRNRENGGDDCRGYA